MLFFSFPGATMKSAQTVSRQDMNKNPRQAGNMAVYNNASRSQMNISNGSLPGNGKTVYKTTTGSPINIGNGKKVYLMSKNGNGDRPANNSPNAVSTNQVRKR